MSAVTISLVIALALELLSEVAASVVALFYPLQGLKEFHVDVSPGTIFESFVIGLLFGLVSAIIAAAIYYICKKSWVGWKISYVLGVFWVIFGGSLFLAYGRTENLYLDFCPGLLIIILTFFSNRKDGVGVA